jgi:ferric-chelate reductase
MSLTKASVCGADALSNDVRSALRDPRPLDILKGGPDVSLHIEAFDLVSFNGPYPTIVETDWS